MQRAHRTDLIWLLFAGGDAVATELNRRLGEAGYSDIRQTHGCVFGNIAPEGTRLTDLADRAGMTKQAVGEVVTDLEGLGYAERVPDPSDGRAKIIRLTPRGREAQRFGYDTIAAIERDWAERYGAERVAALKSLLIDALSGEAALRDAA